MKTLQDLVTKWRAEANRVIDECTGTDKDFVRSSTYSALRQCADELKQAIETAFPKEQ